MACCECAHLIGSIPYFSTVDPPHFSGENRSRFWHKKGRQARSWLVKNHCEPFLLCYHSAPCKSNLNLLVAQAAKSLYIYVPQDSILVLPEATMELSVTAIFASIVIVALLAIYVPTIYIRKTNKLMAILEKIEANTRK